MSACLPRQASADSCEFNVTRRFFDLRVAFLATSGALLMNGTGRRRVKLGDQTLPGLICDDKLGLHSVSGWTTYRLTWSA